MKSRLTLPLASAFLLAAVIAIAQQTTQGQGRPAVTPVNPLAIF